ncbi:hypothetical protein ACSX1A_03370 [Pontibacter sp. MBLB2868]|uniref:hypothetical protein n=1 Tax=Pontibacter sp. MBLB2868 TaxID=3451555 RepID=UPI003F754E21
MKTTTILFTFALLFSSPGFISCSKDTETDGATLETVEATLFWSGDYAVDGCGFTLTVDGAYQKPVNEADIANSYKTNTPTQVEVKLINYHKNVKACQTGLDMNSIKILDIRRK